MLSQIQLFIPLIDPKSWAISAGSSVLPLTILWLPFQQMELWIITWKIREPTLSVFFVAPKVSKKTYIRFTWMLGFSNGLSFSTQHVASAAAIPGSLGFRLPGRTGPTLCGSSGQATVAKRTASNGSNKTGELAENLANQQGPTSLMMSFFQELFFHPFYLGELIQFDNYFTISWKGCVKREGNKNMSPAWLGLTTWRCLPLWRWWCFGGLKVMLYFQHLF